MPDFIFYSFGDIDGFNVHVERFVFITIVDKFSFIVRF
jgi:hypothetical protein